MGKICKQEDCPCYNNNSPMLLPIKSGSNPEIMIVTDSPEYKDKNRIFSGENANFIFSMLQKYKVTDNYSGGFICCTAIRCYADMKNMSESMKTKALKCCKGYFNQTVDLHKPKIIISFGGMALTQTLKHKGIKNRQGIMEYSLEYKSHVMPMYAAGFLLKNMSFEGAWASGFNTINNFIKAGWKEPTDEGKHEFKEVQSLKHLFSSKECLDGIAIDTETQGLDWTHPLFTPISYSVSADGKTGYQIYLFEETIEELKDYSIKWLRKEGSKKVHRLVHVKKADNFEQKLKELRWFLENPEINKIMHNGSYDCHVFKALFRVAGRLLNLPQDQRTIEIKGYTFDTQNAAQLFNENMYNMVKLETLQRDFTDISERYKQQVEKSDMLGAPKELLTFYACLDTICTKKVSVPLKKYFDENKKLSRYMERMVMPTVNTMMEMEHTGAYIDVKGLEEAKINITELRNKEHAIAVGLIPPKILLAHEKAGIKLSRNDLIRDCLYSPDGFNLKPINFTKSKEPSADQDTLKLLQDETRNKKALDFILHFTEYKKYDTLAGRYLSGFEKHRASDGRIHSKFSLCTAVTGRIASCLVGQTLIKVPDSRQEVRIMDVVAGDRVFCYDSKNNLTIATVTWSGKTGKLVPVMTTSYLGKDDDIKELTSTYEHPVRNPAGEYIQASQQIIGSPVRGFHEILSFISGKFTGFRDVYDITVEDHHNFIANGVCVHNSAPNLQNIPNRGDAAPVVRRIISVPEGKKILKADASQAELRWMAHMAQDKAMMKIFREGKIDIHTATAKFVSGHTDASWNKLDDKTRKYLRKQAKAINFGYIYGMSVQGYITYAKIEYGLMDMTEEIGQQHRDGFFNTYRQLPDFYDKMVAFGKKYGYVESSLGRRRRLPELNSSNKGLFNQAMRQAINFPIQAASSDTVLLAANEIMKMKLPKKDFKLILFIHDELVAEVREDCDIDKYARIMKDNIENPPLKELFGINLSIPLESEVEFGDNLNDCKAWEFA